MKIGKNVLTKEIVSIDLNNLIETRLLISANSGGGKSYLARKILEESHGRVQQIIIDLEGEFASLREKYDYLIVGKDGEIPISLRTADILARKLLELNVSTILDLSELKQHERILFVKRFLDSMINSPKELWHNCMIFIDEAHHFCPQGTKSESASAVIDLMTRGRKRGFCGILASQRISKLHKDACAECNNRLIGRTVLDIDRKRASEELGFNSKEQERSLRELEAGEFYAFGTSISKNEIIKTKVDEVKTTHLKVGGRGLIQPSPTPENIKKILKNVIDLPKEAEEEIRNIEDMKRKIQELKTKLTLAEKAKPIIKTDDSALIKARETGFKEGKLEGQKERQELERNYRLLESKLSAIAKSLGQEIPKVNFEKQNPIVTNPIKNIVIQKKVNISPINSGERLREGAMRMLNWLAGAYPNDLSKNRLATLSGFSVSGGTFNTYISELKRKGWIEGNGDLTITQEGMNNASPEEIPSGDALLALWKGKFRDGCGKILEFIYNSYPNYLTKEEIGINTGFESSGGTFNTYISELRRNGLIEIQSGNIKISEEFFK